MAVCLTSHRPSSHVPADLPLPVLNAAILLRGCEPIEVEIRKIPELHIELASTDTGAYGTAESAEEIQDCHNPYDPFALHKAAIIACGILPLEEKADLKKVLEKMGGRFTFTCSFAIV